jgi:hypothetical protein
MEKFASDRPLSSKKPKNGMDIAWKIGFVTRLYPLILRLEWRRATSRTVFFILHYPHQGRR